MGGSCSSDTGIISPGHHALSLLMHSEEINASEHRVVDAKSAHSRGSTNVNVGGASALCNERDTLCGVYME
mgnify:CR=1 FL=1